MVVLVSAAFKRVIVLLEFTFINLSVTQTNEGTLMVQPDFELVCWDFVSNPSTHGAFMNPISLNEGKQVVGKYDKLDTIINNILRA